MMELAWVIQPGNGDIWTQLSLLAPWTLPSTMSVMAHKHSLLVRTGVHLQSQTFKNRTLDGLRGLIPLGSLPPSLPHPLWLNSSLPHPLWLYSSLPHPLWLYSSLSPSSLALLHQIAPGGQRWKTLPMPQKLRVGTQLFCGQCWPFSCLKHLNNKTFLLLLFC